MNANCRSFLTFFLAPGDLGLEDHGGLPGGSLVLECSDGSRGERKLPWGLGSSFGERKDQAKFPEGCIPWWPATPDKEMAPEQSLCASETQSKGVRRLQKCCCAMCPELSSGVALFPVRIAYGDSGP